MRPWTRLAHACLFTASAALLGGCSGASLLSTGSTTAAAVPPPPLVNDPLSRALQVGTTSARAQKCGFNFDPAKLRGQYLASEAAAAPADMQKIERLYDTAFSGVSKAVANSGEGYCTARKTTLIKTALNRHLAGDYTPEAKQPVAEEEDGGGLFGLGGSDSSGRIPTPFDQY